MAGYEGLEKREAKIPPASKICLTEALERLVELYEATGQKDRAEAWRDRNRDGWQSLIPYLAAAAASDTGASLDRRPQTERGMTS